MVEVAASTSMDAQGPAATALEAGTLSAPSQSETVVKTEADGPLEVEERAGGPPLPPAGVQAATEFNGADLPLKSEPTDTLSMPGTSHELGVKPEEPNGPALTADLAQPLDLKPMDVDSAVPQEHQSSVMPTPPSSPPQLNDDLPSSNGKRPADFDDAVPSKRPRTAEEQTTPGLVQPASAFDAPSHISPAALSQPPTPAPMAPVHAPLPTPPAAQQQQPTPVYTPLVRTKLPNEQKRWAVSALKALKKNKNIGPFLTPVDPILLGIPHYPNIVKQPSDISTVEKRLGANVYPTIDSFCEDVKRIFTNCYLFNGQQAPISLMARDCESTFEKMIPKIPPTPDPNAPRSYSQSPQDRRGSYPPALQRGQDGLPNREIRAPKVWEPNDDQPASKSRRPKTGVQGKELRFCREVLREIGKKSYEAFTYPFLHPVDWIKLNIPAYPNIVKQPMDISTIKSKLDQGMYNSPDDFASDFRLMLNNCYLFNPAGSPVNEMGRKLEAIFELKWRDKDESVDGNEDDGGEYMSESASAIIRDTLTHADEHQDDQILKLEAQMEQMRQQMRMLKKGKSTGGGGGSRPKPRTSKSNTSASRPRNSGPRRSTGYGDPDYDLHDDDDSGFLPQESTSLVSFDMKRELANKITNCEGQQLEEAINIIRESAPKLLGEDENQEIELDIDLLDDNTLLKLYNYVVRGERSRRDSISMPKLSAAEQRLASLETALSQFQQPATASPSAQSPVPQSALANGSVIPGVTPAHEHSSDEEDNSSDEG